MERLMALNDLSGKNLDKLELKCKFFLTEVKRSNEKLWEELFDSYEASSLEDLPKWFAEAKEKYAALNS